MTAGTHSDSHQTDNKSADIAANSSEQVAEQNPELEAELTADYSNTFARQAMLELQADPNYASLAKFLTTLRDGFLFADVTGASKKKRTHFRTIRSTQGQLLLPLFTSMNELRAAVPATKTEQAKGALMPITDALRLLSTKSFVAVQFDAGTAAFVVIRKYIDLVLSDQPITAEALEHMR